MMRACRTQLRCDTAALSVRSGMVSRNRNGVGAIGDGLVRLGAPSVRLDDSVGRKHDSVTRFAATAEGSHGRLGDRIYEPQNDRTDQRLYESHRQTQVHLHSGESRLAAGIDVAEVVDLAGPALLAA
jgi:hypothetical protein